MSTEFPVLVVGAGPTGLMLAGELARYGVACRLIDKRPHAGDKSRALVVQPRTTEIFAHLGMADELIGLGTKIHGASAYAGKDRLLHLLMDELDSPFPFIVGVPQTVTEGVLTRRLDRLGVRPEWSTELTAFAQDADGVTATLRTQAGTTEDVRARWVVGCDGAHSVVRKGAGLTFPGDSYQAGFALADARIDWQLPHDELHLFPASAGGGLMAAFPMPGENRYRLTWEFEAVKVVHSDATVQHGQVADAPEPTPADAQRILAERVPFPATLSDPTWLANFRVNSRMATGYRNGRAFLAGDAAHIHSPAGGQGMNTGLQDAFNLAWKLALVEHGRAKPDLLDTYATERHAVGIDLLKTTDRMAGVAMFRHPVAVAVRNAALSAVSGLEVFQQRARRTISELAVGYRESPLSDEHHGGWLGAVLPHGSDKPGVSAWKAFANGPHAGDRAPDAPLTTPAGTAGRVFDLFDDPKRFTLLVFAGRDVTPDAVARRTELAARVQTEWGTLMTPVVIAPTPTAGAYSDPDHAAHDKYGARGGCLYLVRPDGYVGFRSQPADADALTDYLRGWLVP